MPLGARRAAAGLAALVFAAAAGSCSRGSNVRPPAPPVGLAPIADSQPATDAPLFTGANSFADPLARQTPTGVGVSTVRVDSANSGVVDIRGPLGQAPFTASAQTPVTAPMLWDRRGGLTAGCQAQLTATVFKRCLAAVDPSTLVVTARWVPPGQDLNVEHAVVDDLQRIVVTTRQNHVLVVQRPEDAGSLFRPIRDIDLSSSLNNGEVLRAGTEDRRGNIWFTTGGVPPSDGPVATTTTVGYVTSNDQIAVTRFAGQVVQTDVAVGPDDVFVVTAPAAGGSTGYIYRLTASIADTTSQVQTVWLEHYAAGSIPTSPVVLLGTRYLAFADNADDQSHLMVYSQALATGAGRAADSRLVCQVPLFTARASAVTAGPIGYDSEAADSVMLVNGYHASTPLTTTAEVNGVVNNMGDMSPGLTRVDVPADGSNCRTAWSLAVRMKSGPLLSTATGLIYGYSQDVGRAARGSYVWYFVAVDYRSGRDVWHQRVGAGGTKNDNFLPLSLGPDGSLYQLLPLGVTWMRDLAHR